MNKLSVVGSSVIRKDALDKVCGKTRFSADIKIPGMLHVKVLRSKIAHGILKSIDISKAVTLPGVCTVLTAKDVPGTNSHGIILKDEPVLVNDKIRKIGDPLAIVAAETERIALQALELIEIQIKALPIVSDVLEAIKSDSPTVHGDSNILGQRKIRKGNIEEAFKKADIIVEKEYHTQTQEHAYIEPEAGVSYMDGDVVVIKVSTQNTHFDAREVARNLNLPVNRVRIIQAPTGGGFGGKLDVAVQNWLGLVTLHTGLPARMVYSREESIICSGKRHATTIRYKTAADQSGKLLGVKIEAFCDTGAYSSYGPAPVTRLAVHGTGPYEVPNVEIDAYTIYTNNPTAGAFRGFGVPQVTFACEQQLDMIAEIVGISPMDIRMMNTLKKDSLTATGQVIESITGIGEPLQAAYQKAKASIDQLKANETKTKKRGYGMGCMFYGTGNTGQPNPAGAFIDFLDDGTVNLMVGAADMGQGSSTVLAQIAAEELGVHFEDVKVTAADTGVTPDGGASSASRQTYISGNAVLKAAQTVKKLLAKEASCEFDVPVDTIVFKDRQVLISGEGETVISKDITELIRNCRRKGIMTIGHGSYNPNTIELDDETGVGCPYETYAFGSQIVEIEVDIETGEIEVLKIYAAHDVGQAVNPLQVDAQIEGACIQGLGYAIYEEIKKEQGKITTPSFSTYLIPTAMDMPEIHSIIVEEPSHNGPFGVKGLGETALVPTAAAIANALYDAIGIRLYSLPLTPEKVLAALKEKSAS